MCIRSSEGLKFTSKKKSQRTVRCGGCQECRIKRFEMDAGSACQTWALERSEQLVLRMKSMEHARFGSGKI